MSKTYTIEVSDAQAAALAAVAKNDNTTVKELVQEQIDYYLNCVIKKYVETPVALTKEEQVELDALIATTKATFITSKEAVK